MKKRHLIVGDLDRARLSQFLLRPIGEQKLRTFDIGLSVGRPNSAPCKVSFVDLARISYEFLDEEAFADTIEEVLEIGIPPGELYFTAFENEALIWD